jgi:GT2 family glycosyltransferase
MLDTHMRRLVLPVKAKAKVVRPSQQNGRCPSVSVVIPCYNYGRYLTQCVTSVLNQQGVRVDVLVIDDASTDGSDEIVSRLGAQDPRIRTICHTTNQGHIATYNEGLAEAAGDYAVLISADDLLTPGCLARATSLMEEYPSVGFTYGSPIQFTDGDLPTARTTAKSWIIWQGHDWITQRCKAGGNALKSPEAVLRTGILREIGYFRADFPHAADFELWLRAATVSDVGYVAGADQAYYRIHAHNMHHSMFDMLDDFSQRLGCFDVVFREFSGLLEDPDSMRNIAHHALARNALNQAIRDTGHRALARSTLGRMVRPYLRGEVGDEPVGDHAAFALKAWPDARQLREWRALEKLINASDGPPRLNPSLITRIAKRKLRSRFREWRWRTAGM